MNKRLRLVYLSSIAAPHQVRLCVALQDYVDAQFWFYELPDRTRGPWWRVPLDPYCKVLRPVAFFKEGPFADRYFAPKVGKELNQFDPDIVVLGGFSIPSNYVAYRWAKLRNRPVVVFTERSRTRSGRLRQRSLGWSFLRWLYRDVDMVMTSADDAVAQFRDTFGFGSKVIPGRYAADLDEYFHHPVRSSKPSYSYLFANRLTEIYDPLKAIEIFAQIRSRYPGSRMLMNAVGELRGDCERRVKALALDDVVEFLTDIKSWDDLHMVYQRADILLLPATFSNGNFTILEAMASGMGIVISNRILGIGTLVNDDVNGFRCEPTVDAFVERIERYVKSPELFRRHAELNRPLVRPLSAKGTAKFFYETIISVARAKS